MSTPTELSLGDLAPDFKLPSNNGNEVRLVDYQGKSNVILFFVREFI